MASAYGDDNTMPTFIYAALDATGREIQGKISGTDVRDAINHVRQMGYFPTSLNEVHESQLAAGAGATDGAKCAKCGADLPSNAVFCVQCGTFVKRKDLRDEEAKWTGPPSRDDHLAAASFFRKSASCILAWAIFGVSCFSLSLQGAR